MNQDFLKKANANIVTVVLLESFAEVWELRLLLSMLFLLMYLGTLLGNLIIITITTVHQSLNTPMFFFIRNLSILDMCYISVTVPNACINSISGNRETSVAGCATQIFLVPYFIYVEILFLTIMAQDHYVAICQPLHCPIIMNHKFCVQVTLASTLSGFVYAAVHAGNMFRLSFCQSSVVNQFFCDIPSLLRFSCSDTFSNKLLNLLSAMDIAGVCFTFIATSYFHIFSTVLKYPVKDEGGKAFSTCVPHILVVFVFLSSSAYVYLSHSELSEITEDMILSICYTIVPPFLNPIICSLRNKQIKEAVRKVILRMFYSGKL